MKKLVAIAPTHCHLFIAELADAVQILTKSADCLCPTNPSTTTAQILEPAFFFPMNQ
jgi:hypothetical protein